MQLLKSLFGRREVLNFKELRQKGALIVDVRSIPEFKAGHIKDAVNLPLETIRIQASMLKKLNKPVITVCRSGSRSGMAVSILKKEGVEAYNGGDWNMLQRKIMK